MPYSPAEDSYLLEKQIKDYLKNKNKQEKTKLKILDMGSGRGIQALACLNSGIKKSSILCADIDKEALNILKSKKLKAVRSDLFSNITGKFDLIIFNPPYLAKNKYDNGIDTTSGKRGNEIIIKFLKQAKKYLSKKGVILLLFSSLSKPRTILKKAKKMNYKAKKICQENLFFEKLFIYEFKHDS